MKRRPIVLFVGGTDPSGGAGLAADLHACAAMGGHGSIAVTAVTVQNSGGVSSWTPVSPDVVASQIGTTCDDGTPDGVKSGMLGSRKAVEMLAGVLRDRMHGVPFVLDPVMVSGSGHGLAESGLEDHIKQHLIPLAALVTPNLDEAEALTGGRVRNADEMETAAKAILEMGADNVLLKGGHLDGEPLDVLATREKVLRFQGTRIVKGKVHGTGCTLASACATLLAGGYGTEEAVPRALAYLRTALQDVFQRRQGNLLGHFPGMGPLPAGRDPGAFYKTPRFCPSCTAPMRVSMPHPVCGECGLVYYRNPLPAVILLVKSKDRLLIARRASPPAIGELCLPGGFIDLGESPMEAAGRELREETTLIGERMTLIASDKDLTDYGSVVLFVYSVDGWHGNPVPGDDVSELIWMKPADVPELAFKAHDRVIDMVKQGRIP